MRTAESEEGKGCDWWLSLETKCRGLRGDDVEACDWLVLIPVVPPEREREKKETTDRQLKGSGLMFLLLFFSSLLLLFGKVSESAKL